MTQPTSTTNVTEHASVPDDSFWDLYLKEHQNSANCWLHAVGTVASWIVIGAAVWTQTWWLLLLAPIAGYGCAWFGHAFIERNKPLSIKYPMKSFFADYRLTLLLITGRQPHVPKSASQSKS